MICARAPYSLFIQLQTLENQKSVHFVWPEVCDDCNFNTTTVTATLGNCFLLMFI